MFLATTRGAVLRGATGVDELGDPVESDEVAPGYLADFPLSLIEQSRTVFDPTTGTERTIRNIAGRVPALLELAEGDRIRDNRTGKVYALDEIERTPRGIAGFATLSLSLRLIKG